MKQNPKRLYFVGVQLCDILGKAKPWRQEDLDGGGRDAQVGTFRAVELFCDTLMAGGHMTSHICPNAEKVQHRAWALTWTVDFGRERRANLVHGSQQVHTWRRAWQGLGCVWGREHVGTLYFSLSFAVNLKKTKSINWKKVKDPYCNITANWNNTERSS